MVFLEGRVFLMNKVPLYAKRHTREQVFAFALHSASPVLAADGRVPRKVDVRLPGKGNSIFQAARPVHQIISKIKWIRTSRLSMKNSRFVQVFAFAPHSSSPVVAADSVFFVPAGSTP